MLANCSVVNFLASVKNNEVYGISDLVEYFLLLTVCFGYAKETSQGNVSLTYPNICFVRRQLLL